MSMSSLLSKKKDTLVSWSSGVPSIGHGSLDIDGVLTTTPSSAFGLLSLELKLPVSKSSDTHSLLITVLDKSLSMKVNWSKQVVPAMNYLADVCLENSQSTTSVITSYSTTSHTLDITSRKAFDNDFKHVKPAGGTLFALAFDSIYQIVHSQLPILKQKYGNNIKIIVVFLTDGVSTDNKAKLLQKREQLQNFLRNDEITKGIPSVFHALAFTEHHDVYFLNWLRKHMGTQEGGFVYADPRDGDDILKAKIEAILDEVLNPTTQVTFKLKMEGWMMNYGNMVQESWKSDSSLLLPVSICYPRSSNSVIYTTIVKNASWAAHPPAQTAPPLVAPVVMTYTIYQVPLYESTSTTTEYPSDIKIRIDTLSDPNEIYDFEAYKTNWKVETVDHEIAQLALAPHDQSAPLWSQYSELALKLEVEVKNQEKDPKSKKVAKERLESSHSVLKRVNSLIKLGISKRLSISQLARCAEYSFGARFTKSGEVSAEKIGLGEALAKIEEAASQVEGMIDDASAEVSQKAQETVSNASESISSASSSASASISIVTTNAKAKGLSLPKFGKSK